jgi:hypothetical protein
MRARDIVRWWVLVVFVFLPCAVCARPDYVYLHGGGNPRDPNQRLFPGVLNKLKQFEPFKGKSDEEIYQKIVTIRRELLVAIETLRAEDPEVADCLFKLYDANRFRILFGSGDIRGQLKSDGNPGCDDDWIGISIEELPCEDEPIHQQLTLLTTLLHEGRHAKQDFRIITNNLTADQITATEREKDQCNEIEAHDETLRVLAEIDEVLDAIQNGQPIPETAKGLARAIGEAILNDASLSDEQKRELADRLLTETSADEEGNFLVIQCREEAKDLFQQFLSGALTKEQLNAGLSTNGWFLEYGDELGTGPIAYFGEGKTKRFSQVGPGTNRTFVITGLDQLYAFSLLPGGRKGVFVGAETGSGDGVMLGYSDTDGDYLLDENTRTELFRSLDMAGGVHLARNPANGVLMALNRADNTILRLPDTDDDLFPNFVSIAGEFTFERDDVLYLSFSPDGKTAYASAGEQVILRGTEWAIATATDPNGYFGADGVRDIFADDPPVPAFVGVPLNEQPFVWLSGAPGADIYLYHVLEGNRQYLGVKNLDEFGQGVLYLQYPLEAGMLLELEDETHVLFSPLVRVELPHLNIARVQRRIIVDWPGFGYDLQHAFQVNGPFFNVTGSESPVDVLAGPTEGHFFRLQQEQGRAGQALQDPCPDGRLLVRHAYSECQSGGTWHVVEDAWYACPPNGEVKKFRVYDVDTGQPCTVALTPPPVTGARYRRVDSTCPSPRPSGEKVVLMECLGGMWSENTYLVVECVGGEQRIDGPISSVPANPPTRCSDPPPRPADAR